MTQHDFADQRLTEQRNPRTEDIDVASAIDIVDLMYAEDRTVADAVHACRGTIAKTIDLVVKAFKSGGRLIYIGAGTSGRLGVLDAAECPPTFGSSPEMVRGIIAGGPAALVRSQEGAEDDTAAGRAAVEQERVANNDVVVGIAASGTTPFVHAAVSRAQALGAATVLVTCTEPPGELAETCDEVIVATVGPEVLTGSTRLKAGTATKLILNTITTAAMIGVGKAYGNFMVDLVALSHKLRDRGERIVMETCGVDRAAARRALKDAHGGVKLAVVMARSGMGLAEARERLEAANGVVREVVGDPPGVIR